jgi:hypothetical protein
MSMRNSKYVGKCRKRYFLLISLKHGSEKQKLEHCLKGVKMYVEVIFQTIMKSGGNEGKWI